jgi:L-malate glycosyltransferase
MGKPIIATNVGGITEILRDGETGLLVPSKDPVALAEKMKYFFGNMNEARILGRRAKEESKKYDIIAHVKMLENHYRDLLPYR